jgi:hypothetical protein
VVTSAAHLAFGFAARFWWFAIGIGSVEAPFSLTNDNLLFYRELAKPIHKEKELGSWTKIP